MTSVRLMLEIDRKPDRKSDEGFELNVDVAENQRTWRVRKFVAHAIAQRIHDLPLLWKRNYAQDGETVLSWRLLCLYKNWTSDDHSGFNADRFEKQRKVCDLINGKPVYVVLMMRSHSCTHPDLKPRSRIAKKK